MKNELENISTINAPSAVVNQTGEKNVHIDHAENITQHIILNFPYIQQLPSGMLKPTSRNINQNFYNLFVVGGEIFEQNHFVISRERSLSRGYSSEDLRNQYASLSAEAIEEIKTFPSLFMPEANNYNAKSGDEQQAIFGFVDDVHKQDNGIKIKCQLVWPIPMQQISNIGFKLGMKDMDKLITEMNDTHWAIKRINLIEELTDANISLMGINQ
ncbi:hypothetical protein GH808_07465 [Acetobacterium fimetarium]|uniref:Uncharacterized protein n=1 Tax=Acetobacterium fimetarium TaxID=52691 RepID=A0ABR6WUN7_9FIRM|nr:hypothetical protein [Acetobacterium fimetarium]MBC3804270.1 hypothetical protein [Acetobacterium fimetarium]